MPKKEKKELLGNGKQKIPIPTINGSCPAEQLYILHHYACLAQYF